MSKPNNNPRYWIIIIVLAFLAGLAAYKTYTLYAHRYVPEQTPEETSYQDIKPQTPQTPSPEETKTPDPTPTTDPQTPPPTPKPETPKPVTPTPNPEATPAPVKKGDELNLKAAFYSQAPFGNWDFPWQEACEEASILLAANAYYGHNWTREEFNEQILKLVDWEKEKFGTYLDTTAAQTATMMKDYLGLKSVVHENPTYNDIVEILGKGHFIIMFFSGKELGNPNFTNGGPLYHVVLVKGYKSGEKVIVHDVGTRNGANYVYSWKTLQSAMHDFATPIESGKKRMLEVLPPS